MTDLSGKLALITGASRGIGAAVAKGMAQAGAHVILVARTVGGLEEVDDEIRANGGQATLLPMNLLKLEDVDKLGPTIYERFGKLDILVGNAGMLGPLKPAHQVKPKEWQNVMNLNFTANVRMVHTLDPLLRTAPAGRAVFTTSGMADMNTAYYGPYAASKAALNSFVKVYAAETLKTNMKINLLSPGMVDTAMLRDAFPQGPEGPVKQPEDVVNAFLALLSDDCEEHGQVIAA